MSEINNTVEKSENTNESNGLKELLDVETQVEIVGSTKSPKVKAWRGMGLRGVPNSRAPGKNIKMTTKHLAFTKDISISGAETPKKPEDFLQPKEQNNNA